jgi:hypothetical protein
MAAVSSLQSAWDRMPDDLERLGSTATEETIKRDLKRFIDGLSPAEALRFLDMVNNWLDDDELTPEEEEDVRVAREEMSRGEFVRWKDLKRELNL